MEDLTFVLIFEVVVLFERTSAPMECRLKLRCTVRESFLLTTVIETLVVASSCWNRTFSKTENISSKSGWKMFWIISTYRWEGMVRASTANARSFLGLLIFSTEWIHGEILSEILQLAYSSMLFTTASLVTMRDHKNEISMPNPSEIGCISTYSRRNHPLGVERHLTDTCLKRHNLKLPIMFLRYQKIKILFWYCGEVLK